MYDVHIDAGETAMSDPDRYGVALRRAAAGEAYAVHILCDIAFKLFTVIVGFAICFPTLEVFIRAMIWLPRAV